MRRHVDLCVVGAGPAGLQVALRAAAHGRRVLLVESAARGSVGRLPHGPVVGAAGRPGARDDRLVAGPTLYDDDYLVRWRARAIGGSSRLWSVRRRPGATPRLRLARPLPAHLGADEVLDVPAWPVDPAEVDRYLDEAAAAFGMDGVAWGEAPEAGPQPLATPALRPARLWFPAASVVHDDWVAQADACEGVELRTGATLVGLVRGGDRISRLVLREHDGARSEVEARDVVLALGAVATARTLLLAREVGRVPDPHDTLGRWFMDHPHARLGAQRPTDGIAALGRFHDFHEVDGRVALGHYVPTEQARTDHRLLPFSASAVGVDGIVTTPAAAAGAALRNARGGLGPAVAAGHVATLARHPRQVATQLRRKLGGGRTHHTALGGWSDPRAAVEDVDVLAWEAMLAQRPSPGNRVVLDSGTDAHGRRRPRLLWSWSRPEVESWWRTVAFVREQAAAAGGGTFLDARQLGAGPIPNATTGYHQMGGARMSVDPRDGVVDPHGRHHQLENLHVAGGAVFPSSAGWANPTLLLVALSLRLGDRLGAAGG